MEISICRMRYILWHHWFDILTGWTVNTWVCSVERRNFLLYFYIQSELICHLNVRLLSNELVNRAYKKITCVYLGNSHQSKSITLLIVLVNWRKKSLMFSKWNRHFNYISIFTFWQVSFGTLRNQLENSPSSASDLRNFSDFVDIMLKKYITNHPSPICFEKHYREFLIASLPRLQVLDNLSIRETERERANVVFSKYFEQLPYNRQHEESVVSILQKRETRASQSFFSRSLGAAKVGSSSWPSLRPLFSLGSVWVDEMKSSTSFRPRQLEYHPSNPSLMVFGTIDGEIVVVNHETDKIVSYVPTVGAMNSVLGLCWLKKHPSKVCHIKHGGFNLMCFSHIYHYVASTSIFKYIWIAILVSGYTSKTGH